MKIDGAISVKAAIEGNKRIVKEIYIDTNNHSKNFNYIRDLATKHHITINELTNEDLLKLNPGKTFGGILAEVDLRKNDDLTEGDIFYICGIEDPFNLGYVIRNLYAFGINNVILDKRDYTTLDSQILKSSAGAYDYINVMYEDDVCSTINNLKKKGYKIYALSREDESKDMFNVKFNNPSFVILGGEKRGISSKVLNLVDEKLFIPYGNDFRNSLNASNALACVATLLFKQRK